MSCTKCQGCLEWEKNEADWNLMCRNCGKRYYDTLPKDLWEALGAESKPAQTQRRAA